jgi:emfourin
VRVRVTRRGGLAGLTLSAEVEANDAVERALEQLVAAPASGEPPYPDGFEYRFDLSDGRSVTLPEHALPRELDPLLDEFAKKGKPPGA